MHYQPQISTISTAAPPSYSEAINQQPPSKNNFPLPPFGTQTYETHVQPGIGNYPTTSNYHGYNASQPPYNPAYISMETNPPQACIVTSAVVHRKNRNGHVIRRERWRNSAAAEAAAAALKDHFKTIRVIFREANPTGQVFIAGSFARIPVLINDHQIGQTVREGAVGMREMLVR
ncbi:hypothetical protein M0802_001716 [Mischocyttarus mexicanus]|nr:hypothetical protein M0802_001716 [Mischocyttarus mexicanus]